MNRIILVLLCLFFILISIAYSAGSGEKKVDIYYSSSLNGNLDGCDCKDHPRAGLVKRAHYLRNIERIKSLLLDAGDVFDSYEDSLLSDYITESYVELGYDLVAIGDQELSNGTEYLLKKVNKGLFRCSNLQLKTLSGAFKKITSPPIIIKRGGITFSVISLIDPSVFMFYSGELKKTIKTDNPESSLSDLLKDKKVQSSEVRILVFHGTIKYARMLAKRFPDLDIIIAGHEQKLIDMEYVGNTVILSPGEDGNRLGKLTVTYTEEQLFLKNNFILFEYMKDPDDGNIRMKIYKYLDEMKNRLR